MASVLLKLSMNGFAYEYANNTNGSQYHPSLCGAVMGCFTWGNAFSIFSFALFFVGLLYTPRV